MTYAYCLGAGDEFLGNYSTVEEALEVARKDAKIKIKNGFDPFVDDVCAGRNIYIGERVEKHPFLDVDDCVESMQDSMDNISGGIANDCLYLDDLTDDEIALLDMVLNEAVAKWEKQIGRDVTFDFVANVIAYDYEEA